jgi:hypothetical protein
MLSFAFALPSYFDMFFIHKLTFILAQLLCFLLFQAALLQLQSSASSALDTHEPLPPVIHVFDLFNWGYINGHEKD